MRRHDREVTDPAAILAIIEAADSCRLGLVDDREPTPQPYVVALNYGFQPGPGGVPVGTFWFHCAKEGFKLDLLRSNPQVCIQLDCAHEPVINALGCGWGMKFSSVVARGRATIVEDLAQRRLGLDCIMQHYTRLWGSPPGARPESYDDKVLSKTAVFRVDVETLSAKRKA